MIDLCRFKRTSLSCLAALMWAFFAATWVFAGEDHSTGNYRRFNTPAVFEERNGLKTLPLSEGKAVNEDALIYPKDSRFRKTRHTIEIKASQQTDDRQKSMSTEASKSDEDKLQPAFSPWTVRRFVFPNAFREESVRKKVLPEANQPLKAWQLLPPERPLLIEGRTVTRGSAQFNFQRFADSLKR